MTASDILAQLKQLTKGMALICRDVDTLKCESSLHCTTDEIAGNRVIQNPVVKSTKHGVQSFVEGKEAYNSCSKL